MEPENGVLLVPNLLQDGGPLIDWVLEEEVSAIAVAIKASGPEVDYVVTNDGEIYKAPTSVISDG